MVIRVTLAGVENVERDLSDIYTKSIIIQRGSNLFLDESNVDLRKSFIDKYGDGNELFLLIPSSMTNTSILVDTFGMLKGGPIKKVSVDNADGLDILYVKKKESHNG